MAPEGRAKRMPPARPRVVVIKPCGNAPMSFLCALRKAFGTVTN
jgi:hypothetical protein